MPYLKIDQINVYYEVEGIGPALVFIHGAMGTNSHWKYQMRVFSENYRVYALDLPGHGRSDAISKEISIVSFAELVSEVIAQLGMETPVVCGHSMGGAIGLQIALDGPSSLGALVLVGSGAKLRVHPEILINMRTNFRETIDQVYNQWVFAQNSDRSLIETLKQQVLEIKAPIAVADWEACDIFDCRSRLEELQLPTLMIVGAEDKLTPVWYSEYLLDRITGSTLEKVTNAGHYAMIEQPVQFNKVLSSFLERIL